MEFPLNQCNQQTVEMRSDSEHWQSRCHHLESQLEQLEKKYRKLLNLYTNSSPRLLQSDADVPIIMNDETEYGDFVEVTKRDLAADISGLMLSDKGRGRKQSLERKPSLESTLSTSSYEILDDKEICMSEDMDCIMKTESRDIGTLCSPADLPADHSLSDKLFAIADTVQQIETAQASSQQCEKCQHLAEVRTHNEELQEKVLLLSAQLDMFQKDFDSEHKENAYLRRQLEGFKCERNEAIKKWKTLEEEVFQLRGAKLQWREDNKALRN